MKRYKKEEVHMIDMSGRLNMKIVHEEYTIEDEKEWEYELTEINKKMEEHRRRYEENLQLILDAALSDTQPAEKDADYFIHKYSDRLHDRSINNNDYFMKLYNQYLEKQG